MSYCLPPPRIQRWALTQTRPVGDYRVFSVHEHELLDSGGGKRGSVHTFQCPDWCNMLAFTEARELVLVWQYRFGTDRMSLEVPGGVIDPGESPKDAACRELLEESGFVVTGSVHELLCVEVNPALQNNRCYSYVTKNVTPSGAQAFDANEELEVVLVPESDLSALLASGEIRHALVRIALEAYLRSEPANVGSR